MGIRHERSYTWRVWKLKRKIMKKWSREMRPPPSRRNKKKLGWDPRGPGEGKGDAVINDIDQRKKVVQKSSHSQPHTPPSVLTVKKSGPWWSKKIWVTDGKQQKISSACQKSVSQALVVNKSGGYEKNIYRRKEEQYPPLPQRLSAVKSTVTNVPCSMCEMPRRNWLVVFFFFFELPWTGVKKNPLWKRSAVDETQTRR